MPTWLDYKIVFLVVIFLNISLSKNNDLAIKDIRLKKICRSKHIICRNGGEKVCAVRKTSLNTFQYKNFDNPCYLYLFNVCYYHDKAFSIVNAGSCDDYQNFRRHVHNVNCKHFANITKMKDQTITYDYYYSDENKKHSKDVIEESEEAEEEKMVYDGHPCPKSCTEAYDPVCLSINRGYGMHFKFLTFVNHCKGDKYYCEHPKEFVPPPEASGEIVRSSMLSWSYCGSHRYLQFARFAEVASSMSYFGWLKTDKRYTKILSPEERVEED